MNKLSESATDLSNETKSERFSLSPEMSLGKIAVGLPGATAVFRRLKLDFCCGGQISLQQAAADKGLDAEAILQELKTLQHSDQKPQEKDPVSLINHILLRYHEVHRAQLPELIRMSRRVEAVHRENSKVPAGLADLLEQMHQELLAHMKKEEEVLFPLLQAGGNPFVIHPISMMRAEHTEHGAMLERADQLTDGLKLPEGASNTWQALYASFAQFRDDLTEHIHLENNVLFPQFERVSVQESA